jgi:membrane-associated phospholipid phosphatase
MFVTTSQDFNYRPWRIIALIFFPLWLIWTVFSLGVRIEHFVVAFALLSLFWINPRTAQVAAILFPMLLGAIIYDNARLLIGLRGEIHVANLYMAELRWFGINTAGGRQILTEFFQQHHCPLLDLICGIGMLGYIALTVPFGLFISFKDWARAWRLVWAFVLLNAMGVATFLLYPAAPPWYVEKYGLGPAILDALPSAAGAARIDQLLGVPIFANFYTRAFDVFGAMPSLHCAYPMLLVCATLRMGYRYSILPIVLTVLVCFSVIYFGHHYVLDVIAGILYAVAAYLMVLAIQKLWAHAWAKRAKSG